MNWFETYPHSVFASALLSDGKLISWKIGNPAKDDLGDWNKDFAWSGRRWSDFTNITISVKEYTCNDKDEHSAKLKEAETYLATEFELHENHMGAEPRCVSSFDEFVRIRTPHEGFISSNPEELAEKLLKASCCYCAFGKDGELNCTNTEGAHCKEGILAYLTGKTLD